MPMRDWKPAVLLLLGATPLLATRPAPLQDWPNHVARIHILTGLLRGDGFWTTYYRFVGFLVPNAALDLGILGLTRTGLSIEAAAQGFLVAAYLVFVAGFCSLGTPSLERFSLGRFSLARLSFAILLFYSNALFWGLASYVLGIGLMMGLLALWLRAERHPWRQVCIAGAGAVLLLFTHVIAAVAWITVLACFDLTRLIRQRQIGVSSVVALIAVAILLHALPGGTGHDFSMHYAGVGLDGIIVRKFELFGRILLGGSLLQDAASVAALVVCVAATALARPRIDAAPALAAAALAVMTVAAPERLGTGSVLDTRIAVLPLLLLAAMTRIAPGRLAVAAVTSAVLVRTLILAAAWHSAGSVFRDFREQTATLPAGSLMMVGYGTRLPLLTRQQIWSPAITAIATQVAFRDVFMPAIFANPAQQPIALRPQYQSLTQPWNLTDAVHLEASAKALVAVCATHQFPRVTLTVLYPGRFLPAHLGRALLHAQPDFLILDACRLG